MAGQRCCLGSGWVAIDLSWQGWNASSLHEMIAVIPAASEICANRAIFHSLSGSCTLPEPWRCIIAPTVSKSQRKGIYHYWLEGLNSCSVNERTKAQRNMVASQYGTFNAKSYFNPPHLYLFFIYIFLLANNSSFFFHFFHFQPFLSQTRWWT